MDNVKKILHRITGILPSWDFCRRWRYKGRTGGRVGLILATEIYIFNENNESINDGDPFTLKLKKYEVCKEGLHK